MRAAILFVLIYFAFDRLAVALGSARGEAGLVVAAAVLALVVMAERWLTRTPVRSARSASACRHAAQCSQRQHCPHPLLWCLPLLASFVGLELSLRPNAAWLARGGFAEELLFRGFMYRHLRSSRTWPGALLHGVIQGGNKVLADDDAAFQSLAVTWLALGIAAPWLFFLLRPRHCPTHDAFRIALQRDALPVAALGVP